MPEGLYLFLSALCEAHNYDEWEVAKDHYGFTDDDWHELMLSLNPDVILYSEEDLLKQLSGDGWVVE